MTSSTTRSTTRKSNGAAVAVCAAWLTALAACSPVDEPFANDEPFADSAAPAAPEQPLPQQPLRIAVAEPPAADVPAPAADAPVQDPASRAPPTPTPVATLAAKADVQGVSGNEAHGTVEFYLAQPSIAINVDLSGLKPGNHGFHVHENGDCGGAHASAAGTHLNPHDARHGGPTDTDERHHAGDLGNVRAEDDGTVKQWLRTEDLQLQGPAGIVGKAIVVHTSDDDLKSQPSGESGEPIACGVIKAATL
jgi:Cu-Zn family superoxide dismutase